MLVVVFVRFSALPSFPDRCLQGADYVEFDVHVSRDGLVPKTDVCLWCVCMCIREGVCLRLRVCHSPFLLFSLLESCCRHRSA
jgi:hypothetical protein